MNTGYFANISLKAERDLQGRRHVYVPETGLDSVFLPALGRQDDVFHAVNDSYYIRHGREVKR